jgi:hypothetical protein
MIVAALKYLAIQALIMAIPGLGQVQAGVSGLGILQKMLGIKLADGGIVTKPTFAMIGEAGAEAVIPLGALNKIMNSGNNMPTFQISQGIKMDELVIQIRKTENRQSRNYGI